MNIKKPYQELVKFLEDNQTMLVGDVLREVYKMTEAKHSGGSEIGSTFYKNEHGETVAIFCYYFKKWMMVDQVEFGHKASSASGYNTMCKEGVRLWTRQQREAKKAKERLLADLSDGTATVEEIPMREAEIEVARKEILEAEEPLLHYDTLECLLEDNF